MVLACGALPTVRPSPDDLHLDDLWLALRRGDLPAAEAAAAAVGEATFAERARLDLLGARRGRAAALGDAWDGHSWWAARYLASAQRAREGLDEAAGARGSAAWFLEQAHRAAGVVHQAGWARRALAAPVGGLEALAVVAEALLARSDWAELTALLEQAPASARLADVAHRFAVRSGRRELALLGLLDDLERDRLTPAGLELLGRLLEALPRPAAEARTLARLQADRGGGSRWLRAKRRVGARLLARCGRLAAACQSLSGLSWLDVEDSRRLERWRRRLALEQGGGLLTALVPATPQGLAGSAPAARPSGDVGAPGEWAPEEQIDADRQRVGSPALQRLRLFHEWDLAARRSYRQALKGDESDLDGFLRSLDEAASPLGAVPELAGLPRDDFGLFGEMLAVQGLAESLPEIFLIGGQGLLLPPEISVYDRLAAQTVEVDGHTYEQVAVRRLRVPGFVASQGARFTGAGIVHTVFVDTERVAAEAARMASITLGPEVAARPAADRASRRSLDEPLDQVSRLRWEVVQAAGPALVDWLGESLALHEGQHILDAQTFLARGQLGRLMDLLSAGLLPGAVRAEVERRAQLRALQQCLDPRLPLADLLAQVPLEGARQQSEHARGYAGLLAAFVARLDAGDYPGARPLRELGLDPDRVLIQQLHKLSPEVVRAVALALGD